MARKRYGALDTYRIVTERLHSDPDPYAVGLGENQGGLPAFVLTAWYLIAGVPEIKPPRADS